MIGSFPRVYPGQKIDYDLAQALNRAFEEIERLGRFSPALGDDIQLEAGPGGFKIRKDPAAAAATAAFNGCKVKSAGTVTNLPNGASTPLVFDTIVYDTNGYANLALPTQLTIPSSGYYCGGVTVELDSNPTGYREVFFQFSPFGDGNTFVLVPANINGPIVTFPWEGFRTAGDTASVQVFQNSGSLQTALLAYWWLSKRGT